MALSKKHYEAFAERFQQQLADLDMRKDSFIINEDEYAEAYKNLNELAAKFSMTFKWDNPRFDSLRFLAACGF